MAVYRSKRDAAKTPEPMGAATATRRAGAAPTFVIQEHHARALHWDFRLEHEGVLVSWALPKGLPDDPHRNHLAVPTEDHPLAYGTFEGDIPSGEYGAGHVSIWDHGTFELEKWRRDEVMVVLRGRRTSGRYVLFRTSGKNWMIHLMDAEPEPADPIPRSLAPMLALSRAVPEEGKWAYEFKWDGVRALVYVEEGRVRALTRNQKNLVPAFPELGHLGTFLGARSAVIDGEIVAFDETGRPDFGLVSRRLHVTSARTVERLCAEHPAHFLAFDLLFLDGVSLLAEPYDERRRRLEALDLQGDTFATPPSFRDDSAADVMTVARERRLEGVVVKRRDSPYAPGVRNGDWIKVKLVRTQEVVVGGWTEGRGARAGGLGALLLGLPAEGGLAYVGKVGTGFDALTRRELLTVLRRRRRSKSPFATGLKPAEAALAHFVRPDLVGEVQFSEWTSSGHLRHPSWRGLRDDKAATGVSREP